MNGVRMVEKEDCKHIFASKILTDMTKEKDLDLNEKDQVFIVAIKPSFVAVVYPKQRDVIQKVRKPGLESYKNTKYVKT